MSTEFVPTVFLIDDDDAVRQSLGLSLQLAGFTVETYSSAEAFLSACCADRFGCLVLDVRMPGMGGPALQEALNRNGWSLPIIFITGHGDIPMAVRTIKAGAVDFLEKPFGKQILTEKVNEALAVSEQRRERAVFCREVVKRFAQLTARERQVMALLVESAGADSSKIIARRLGISHRTVDHHRAQVMEKMQVRTVAELIDHAASCELALPPLPTIPPKASE